MFQACQNLLKVESFTDLTPEVQKLKMNGEATPRKSEKGSEAKGDAPAATPQPRRVTNRKDKMNPKEKRECEVVERLIKTYFLIIRKNIQVISTHMRQATLKSGRKFLYEKNRQKSRIR